MRTPLENRIGALRGQVRRALAIHGLSWVAVAALLWIVVACVGDWTFHLAREVRFVLLVGLIASIVYLLARFVVAPLVVRFRDLDIALKIENRWPGLNDRLASTIQFLQIRDEPGDRDDILGSKALREATVQQTLKETENLDFREVVDARPARRAGLSALGALALGLGLFALAPSSGKLALTRLFKPFGNDPWPQQTKLVIAENTKSKIARGAPFVLEVGVQKGYRVPSSAKVTYRYEDGQSATESLRPDDHGKFHGRIDAASQSFSFSVAAGDDSTKARRVEVVPPPAIADATIKLALPGYTGIKPQTLAPGRNQIQAVVGTKVEISAKASKPLASAALASGEMKPWMIATQPGKSAPAAIAPSISIQDGNVITATFELAGSGPFWFELKDREGFQSIEAEATRYEARAVKDEAPRVVIDDPPSDKDVTPDADVPIAVNTDDDFGIGAIRIVYKTAAGQGSESSKQTMIPLWSAEANADPEEGPVKHQEVKHLWSLASLQLAPGAVITFHAEALDLHDRPEPNLGKSREIRLRVATKEELARQLDDKRRAIREEIDRTLAMQKQAIRPVEDALRTLDRTPNLDPAQRDEVRNAATIQRQVTGRVESKSDGLDQRIQNFLDDLNNLKIDNAEVRQQMEQMKAGVDRIRQQHLTPAERGLTRATKSLEEAGAQPNEDAPQANENDSKREAQPSQPARSDQGKPAASQPSGEQSKSQEGDSKSQSQSGAEQSKSQRGDSKSQSQSGAEQSKSRQGEQPAAAPGSEPGPRSPKESLADSGKNQKAIADELQKMLENLSEFETYRGVVQDAKKLLKEQDEAMKAAAEAASRPDLVGKTPDKLSPQQEAALEGIAAKQSDVAKTLGNLEKKMDEMANRLEQSDPTSSSALRDASSQSRERDTAGKMNKASDKLKDNQIGEAQRDQKEAQQDLKKLVDSLANRRENELARLVKELKQAERDLNNLRDRQQKNRDQTKQARGNSDPKQRAETLQKLAKEQKEIQEQLKRELQRLRKLRADAAAQAGDRAAEKMAQAQQDQEEDEGDDAEQEQDEALANLDEAQEELEQTRRDAEEQLAMEQLARVSDDLKTLSERQATIVDDTAGYEKLKNDKGLTRAQQQGVLTLKRVQESIKGEADDLITRLDAAPSFAMTLTRAGESMDRAAARLKALKTDDDTLRVEKLAHRRIQQLLEALKPENAKNQPGGQQQDGQQGGQPGGRRGGGGDNISKIAQLKVLKSLQEELNERTDELDTIRTRKKELKPEQQAELDRLQEEQRTIADLTRDLVKPKRSDGEQ